MHQNSLHQRSPIVSLHHSSSCVKIPKVKIPTSQFCVTNIPCVSKPLAGYSQMCYKLTISGWQEFAIMKKERGYTAGVMHKNRFHVFGGRDNSIHQTSEFISIDGGVEYGPQLPTSVWQHAITSINSTVSLLSGGCLNSYPSYTCYSPLTWYINHETNVFSSGPSLLEGRRSHGSATIVDKVTKEKIPMVTGGSNGFRSDSTELLINGMWQPGTNQLKKQYFDLFQ